MSNAMSSSEHSRFGLRGEGVLEPGSHADLVVFDPVLGADRDQVPASA